jgi:hypothetical protein
MTTWIDKSDRRGTFFDGGDFAGLSPIDCFRELFQCLREKIVEREAFGQFDLLLLEVNCDTGRVIVGVTTHDRHSSGKLDGCSLRCQFIQDYWYDLLESEPSDDEFTTGISARVREMGMIFRDTLIASESPSFSKGFLFRVYGNDRGVVVYEEEFSRK